MSRRVLEEVFAPTKGLDYRVPDTLKDTRVATNINNCRIADGTVRKDWGHVTYGGSLPMLGTPCMIDVYREYDGDLRPMSFNTTNIYSYNTSTSVWEVIGRSAVVNACDAQWDAQANVTASAEATTKKRGSASAKLVVGAAFTTGLAASEDFSSLDVTSYTYLHFWARSSVTMSAGDLSLRLSEEATGGDGATYADYNLPALVADTWTECEVALASPDTSDGGTYPDDLNALLSVALIVETDSGAQDVYIDDIRATDRYTGDQDDSWEGCVHNGQYFAVNVDDPIQRRNEQADFDDMAGAGDYKAHIIRSFKNHLNIYNTIESGTPAPHNVRWTIIGTLSYASSDWTGTGSGASSLIDTSGHIVQALPIGDEMIIYKKDAIFAQTWIGGTSIYRFDLRVPDIGLLSQKAIVSRRGRHYFVGTDYNVYEYTGTREVSAIGDEVATHIASQINPSAEKRVFIELDEDYDEIVVHFPTGSATQCNRLLRYNYTEKTWAKSDRDFINGGQHQTYSNVTYGSAVGTYGQQTTTYGEAQSKTSAKVILFADSSGYIYQLDRSTVNLNGSAQDSYFDTVDFTFPAKEDNYGAATRGDGSKVNYLYRLKRVLRTLVEASGNAIDIWYSLDSGSTWNSPGGTSSHTLSSEYALKQSDLDMSVPKIRLRFRNDTVSSDMRFRYFAIEFLVEMFKNG